MNWYLWARKHFLAHTRLGRGNLPEFYKHWDWFIFIAARLGDVEFFKDFALAKRHKVEPRNVQYWLMLAWMPAALWSCNQDAVAKLLHKRCNAWGNNPPAKRGEAVRRGWQLLRLGPSRDEDYRIADFNSNWQPVLRG
jgi:hypothetical protein